MIVGGRFLTVIAANLDQGPSGVRICFRAKGWKACPDSAGCLEVKLSGQKDGVFVFRDGISVGR